jgi:hypothetical protein
VIPPHPFEKVAPGRLRFYVAPISALCVVLFMVMDWLMDTGPTWESFSEFTASGSPERAAAILEEWSVRDRTHVAFVSGFDFLFGPLYANLLALASIWASRVFRRPAYVELGIAFAWIAWLVLLLDIPENLAYFNMARGLVDTPWPQISAACVKSRTVIVIVALTYIGMAILVRWRERSLARAGARRD